MPFGRPLGFVETFLQLFDKAIALGELLAQSAIFLAEFFELLQNARVHADLDSDKPCQLSMIFVICRPDGKESLNNHVWSLSQLLFF